MTFIALVGVFDADICLCNNQTCLYTDPVRQDETRGLVNLPIQIHSSSIISLLVDDISKFFKIFCLNYFLVDEAYKIA